MAPDIDGSNPEDGFADGEEGEMPWESAAREAIEGAVAGAEFDEVRGSVYLMSDHDHKWNAVEEEFRDWETLQNRLIEIGENEWINNVPFDGGEAVFEPSVVGWVEDFFTSNVVEGFFSRVASPDEGEELASAEDLLNKGAGLVLQIDVSEIN